MIKKEEIYDLVDYLNKGETKKMIDISLKEEKWKINYIEFTKNSSIENIEKKIYKNSFNEEFVVYKFDKKVDGKPALKKYIIKLADKKYIGVIYHINFDKYFLIKTNAVYILNKSTKLGFDQEMVLKIRDVIKKVCEDNDVLFKKQLKNLVNKKEKEVCYEIINKQILNRAF